jgi:hypothetical protein
MYRYLRSLTLGLAALLLLAAQARSQEGLGYAEQVYDFGHIGIDYQVYHEFKLFNSSSKPIKIDSVRVPCECSSLTIPDSTIRSGDTVRLKLSFSTKNFYGLTSKSIVVFSNDARFPRLELFYVSTIGQWLQGLKPEPISLFYLPGQNAKKVIVHNTQFDSYTITLVDQADQFIDVKMPKTSVSKGSKTEIEVSVKPNLGDGTYQTSFRLQADVPGLKQPVFLTIPVKISRY